MSMATPMRRIAKFGRFQLFHADGPHFAFPGFHLWTGRCHRQVWPLRRFGRKGD